MTATLRGADIHGFFRALGIALPAWATRNASVTCFAEPEQHHNADRHPSASVDLVSGAWFCHGCGAHGGAYDAAITRGHTARSAIDLMIAHGLIEPRSRLRSARELVSVPHRRLPSERRSPRALQATEEDVHRWQRSLTRRPNVSLRLAQERGWSTSTMRDLGVGCDRTRITIPIRDAHNHLTGVLRYQPFDDDGPKMLAVPGTQLGLIPHPEREPSRDVLLVEGPPDMIAARSHGLPAIAVPGDHAWRDDWVKLFAGRNVTVVMDSDSAGRAAAARIRDALADACVRLQDLAPDRDDGYDLTDWLMNHGSSGWCDELV